MATGKLRSASHELKTLDYAHSSALAAGDLLLLNGQVTVAFNASAANEVNAFVYEGLVSIPKEASLAINPGDKVYWVAANSNVNKTASGNTACGLCVSAALAADTEVLIHLRPN